MYTELLTACFELLYPFSKLRTLKFIALPSLQMQREEKLTVLITLEVRGEETRELESSLYRMNTERRELQEVISQLTTQNPPGLLLIWNHALIQMFPRTEQGLRTASECLKQRSTYYWECTLLVVQYAPASIYLNVPVKCFWYAADYRAEIDSEDQLKMLEKVPFSHFHSVIWKTNQRPQTFYTNLHVYGRRTTTMLRFRV